MQKEANRYSRRSVLKAATGAALGAALAATVRRSYARAADIDGSAQFRAVVSAVEEAMAAAHVPGVALGIIAGGREEVATLGLADLGSDLPVTRSTLFSNGSISKTYTAMALMQLFLERKLEIDVPVRTYLPELKLADQETEDRVTIRHLLTHTGGWWGDGFMETGDGDDALQRFVSQQMPRFPQISRLGAFMNYNNAGYSVLGRVIEAVTGKTYREAMQDLVFEPLGLNNSTFDPAVATRRRHAFGYGSSPDSPATPVTPLFLPRSVDPAGGIWTDIDDQLQYARAQFTGATEAKPALLSRDALRQMQSPLRDIGAEGEGGVGWAWGVFELEGMRMISHDGATFSQTSKLSIAPEQGFAVATLTNSRNGGAVNQAALNEALQQYLGVSLDGQQSAQPPEARTLSNAEMQDYAGSYQVPSYGLDLTVEAETLQLHHYLLEFDGLVRSSIERPLPDAPVTFLAGARDAAIVGTPARPLTAVEFIRRADGSVGWIVLGNRMLPKLS